jgi:uncharacterized protein YceH (UPF0502 family)
MEMCEDDDALLLTAEEARVLGSLMEKAVTTPDAYPLTFNSLLTACNQKTNRDPVVNYDEAIVAEAVEGLRTKHLLYRVDGAGARAQKYKHRIQERLGLTVASQALLTVLLLRGPQTLGELRMRSERLYSFADTGAVEIEMRQTLEDVEIPLWRRLEQAPGQKEARYMHLLYGFDAEVAMSPVASTAVNSAVEEVKQCNERVGKLEAQVESLAAELVELRAIVADFRKQFE